MSDSVLPQRQQPTRLRRPWDSPGKNTGVGCHFLLQRDRLPTPVFLGFPGGSTGKKPTYNVGDLGSIPGLGRSPGEGKGSPLQYSGLENYSLCGHDVSDMTEQLSLWSQGPTLSLIDYLALTASATVSIFLYCCSVTQLCPALQPHRLQHARLPCPSSPGVCSNS